jgi:membrane fusion protein (multidrug efflux system)
VNISFPKPAVLLAVIPFLFLSSCSGEKKKEAAAQQRGGGPGAPGGQRPPARVDVFVVQASTVSESIEVPGSIVAEEATEIHPEVSGRVTGLYVREGAQVQKGALLAKLYDGDLQAQRRKLEVQLKIAQTTESRHEALVKIGGISRQDYDLTALQVSNLRADLDIIRTSIAKTEVRAPFSGKLGLKEISTGAYVTPQSIVTTIQKTSGLRIDFNVPEKYTSQIRKGQYVNFSVEGSDRKYTAVVLATESGIAEATRSLTIRATVKGDEAGLIPGGFARVRLEFEPDPNALLIPTQAVIPQARGKKVYLYNGGNASFVDVETGVRDSSMVQVVSGLKRGDSVIITGLLGLKPDAKVQLRQVTNAKP